MRNVFAIIMLFCLGSAYSQFNDLEQAELKGPVKKVESYQNNKLVKISEFSPDGYVTKASTFDAAGRILESYNKRYDSKKRQIYHEDAQFIDVTAYDDGSGRKSEIRLNTKTKDTIQATYSFSQNNQLNKTETFKFKKTGGKIKESQKDFSYDDKNRLVKEVLTDYVSFDESGKPRVTETHYEYSGGKIKRTWQDNKGEWIVNENFQFPVKPDYEGIRVQRKMVFTNPGDKLTFDTPSKTYTRIHYNENKTVKQVTTYAEDARKLTDEYLKGNSRIARTEFFYDSHNNLIETKSSDLKNGSYTLRYVISYY